MPASLSLEDQSYSSLLPKNPLREWCFPFLFCCYLSCVLRVPSASSDAMPKGNGTHTMNVMMFKYDHDLQVPGLIDILFEWTIISKLNLKSLSSSWPTIGPHTWGWFGPPPATPVGSAWPRTRCGAWRRSWRRSGTSCLDRDCSWWARMNKLIPIPYKVYFKWMKSIRVIRPIQYLVKWLKSPVHGI